jgi:hypothetical protein
MAIPYQTNSWLVNTVCAEGHVFMVSYTLGRQSGAVVRSVQVYEVRDGKKVPMRCDSEAIKKARPKKKSEK